MARTKAQLISLPLQVVLYFCGWYLVLFYVAEISLIIYKGKYELRLAIWLAVAIETNRSDGT